MSTLKKLYPGPKSRPYGMEKVILLISIGYYTKLGRFNFLTICIITQQTIYIQIA
jgi:hypothetical protein